MATIDKTKFQFVKRDDFASETILNQMGNIGLVQIATENLFLTEYGLELVTLSSFLSLQP